MSRTSTKTASKLNSTSHLLNRSSKAKNHSLGVTSETIAMDLAAFRKQGGHIEVLGNTPLRPRVSVTAFSSKGNTQRKAAATTTGKAAAAQR